MPFQKASSPASGSCASSSSDLASDSYSSYKSFGKQIHSTEKKEVLMDTSAKP